MAYRDITQYTSGASDFSTETFTASVEYGYPITEFQRLIYGVNWQESNLLADSCSSSSGHSNGCRTMAAASRRTWAAATIYGTYFSSFDLVVGWIFDSRNRALFADRGARHRLTLSSTIPGADVEYYTVNYTGAQFVPLGRYFTLAFNLDMGFGDSFGNTTAIVPYRNYFAGGPDTVRGYKENFLGPRDSFGNPYGGNLLMAAQTELILPIPEKWRSRSRFTLFFDVGNVFSTGGVDFRAPDGITPINYDFDLGNLKQSVGISASVACAPGAVPVQLRLSAQCREICQTELD